MQFGASFDLRRDGRVGGIAAEFFPSAIGPRDALKMVSSFLQVPESRKTKARERALGKLKSTCPFPRFEGEEAGSKGDGGGEPGPGKSPLGKAFS